MRDGNGPEPPGGAARRREIRMPVRLLGRMTEPGGSACCVQVTDLSRGGACCQVAKSLPPGVEVELALDGLSARAIVCWASGAQLGLRFVEPLRASDILIQSSRSRGGASPDRPAYIGGAGRSARQTG